MESIKSSWLKFAEDILKRFFVALFKTSEVEAESLTNLFFKNYFSVSHEVFRIIEDEEILNRIFVLSEQGKEKENLSKISEFVKILISTYSTPAAIILRMKGT